MCLAGFETTSKLSMGENQTSVEELWRQALHTYHQEGLYEHLSEEWPGDGNVTGRISYEYPPTFQPEYVGHGTSR